MRAREELGALSLQNTEEPTITGLLVMRARELTEMDDADPWMEHLEILDDPPQNDSSDRLGKARPRIDIEFVETKKGKRPRFHIEAKRLYRSDSINEYFIEGGLGMFLKGAYASDWPSAGMIGYVQTKNCSHWQSAISKSLAIRKRKTNSCVDQPQWGPVGWKTEGLTEVHETCHERVPVTLGRIKIFHLLLDFTGTVAPSK